MKSIYLLICILSTFSFLSCTQTKRVADRMYISFDHARYCVRRMNGTHEIGCQSSMNGNSGRMYMIDNDKEFDSFLVDDKRIDSFSSFIIVLNADLFSTSFVDRLMTRLDKKLNGLLIYLKSNETRPKDFSHDDQCPNRRHSFYLNQTSVNWNPKGTGLFFRSFPFPIMLLDELDDYKRLVHFYQQFNSSASSPSCGLELKAFQNAAHTSKTCMRRNDISHSLIDLTETFCDPIGGLNIHSKLPQSIRTTSDQQRPLKSVVLILARTDAFQMFLKNKGPTGGVQQPAVALISFLALAHLIGQEQNSFNSQGKEILFLTLDGDALDYSASFKFIFDMINNYFPNGDQNEQRIKLENIHSVIELQSLSMTDKLSLYSSPSNQINQSFIDTLIRNDQKINSVPSGSNLPPASSQIFLRQSSSSFPAYILTSAENNQLSNHYYHSFMDDPTTLNIDISKLQYNTTTNLSKWIKSVVEPLAQSLLESYVGVVKNLSIEQEIVDNLVYCVLKNLNCPLIHNATNQSIGNTFQSFDLVSMPFSINTYPTSTTPTFPFVQYILGYFLRDRAFDSQNLTETACKDLAKNDSLRVYSYVGGYRPSIASGQSYPGYCVRSYMRSAQSLSPAFVINKYDLSDQTYPTWTESRWTTISLRLFVIPTRSHETMTLIIGIFLLLISFIALFILRVCTKISLLQPSSS